MVIKGTLNHRFTVDLNIYQLMRSLGRREADGDASDAGVSVVLSDVALMTSAHLNDTTHRF